ncbi:PQQ-binding-like beta-propeller repeat protein [Kitasatospora sp. NPDC057223]|uniref:outer membrane protein assembly factor BamB family protein n=1 Tax=Kitasatospora sp. NPDC057223 TaxID=3346055 RepID=UPI003625EB91
MAQDLPPAVGPHGQQPWYPGQEQPQQPWPPADGPQWQQAVPAQREPDGYSDGYGYQQPAPSGHGQNPYGDTGHQPGYAPRQDHSYGQYPAYDGYQDTADGQLYAPAGAEYPADGYLPYEPVPGPVPQPVPAAAPTAADASRGDRPRPSLAARVRTAAETVVSADHAPTPRALAVRAGAGLAALAVLVTAGVMVSGENSGADTGSPSAAASGEKGFTAVHTKAWSAEPAAAAQPGSDDTLLGSWLLGGSVVRAEAAGVQAYDLATGKAGWAVEPPAAGAVPCGLSSSVNGAGLGAVLFRPQADPASPCTLVVAVDTGTGKTVWTKTLSDAKDHYGARIGVTDDKVIAVGDDKVLAWQAADGVDVWQYTGQGKFCTLSGGVQGGTVFLHSSCADSTPVDQAVSLNTADGKVGWAKGLTNQPKTVTVLSAEPAVLGTTGAQPADDRIFAWGATGDPAAEVPVLAEDSRIDAVHGSFSATPGMFFQGSTMAVTLVPAAGGPVAIAAYDLTTGKQQWKAVTAGKGEKGKVRAVGLDNGALLLAADERLGQPARLSRFALASGQETVGGSFPQGTGSLLIAGRVLIGGDEVVAVPEHSATFGIASAYRAKG